MPLDVQGSSRNSGWDLLENGKFSRSDAIAVAALGTLIFSSALAMFRSGAGTGESEKDSTVGVVSSLDNIESMHESYVLKFDGKIEADQSGGIIVPFEERVESSTKL